jgi:hypothetical protein
MKNALGKALKEPAKWLPDFVRTPQLLPVDPHTVLHLDMMTCENSPCLVNALPPCLLALKISLA